MQFIPHPFYKRPPGEKEANGENQQASFDHFFPKHRVAPGFHPWHHKSQGIPNSKQEEGEYQVGGSEPVPGRMLQGIIYGRPGTGIIYQDHEADRGSAKNIEGVKALVHKQCLGIKCKELEVAFPQKSSRERGDTIATTTGGILPKKPCREKSTKQVGKSPLVFINLWE